ncbi:hypothetical protein M406DRAFT_343015 [Cryphonectria parasitica EP155]|uniref:Uncharacterized protein n=1 Tax=Cryphonectria parasitica (strain ATCC 38755 / EP155) TaxID=660469 RepID=A0A9P5CK63_CRYP1|nr:uncharacterized protein M406DRAFT_343015 [Cryphonectria parasitica EP155]KAF3760847.1 hypothetical protein M406DRAFT_343015 [Cryphonectria parasitica EP155]
MAHEAAPEQLVDVFRTAALSVTKLYKSSITAQQKARAAGYQDCLDDLLQFLDREHLGLDDGEGWKIRAWANERLEARDGSPGATESEDDSEKPEAISSSSQQQQSTHLQTDTQAEMESDTPIVEEVDESVSDPSEITVPSQEFFSFRSSHPYPQDAQNQLNIGNLHLSDNHTHDSSKTTPRSSRSARHHGGTAPRRPVRVPSHLGRGAGSKRHLNYEELFGLANLGQFKDGGPASKRRHL